MAANNETERRIKKPKSAEIRGIAMRMIREGVRISSLKVRKGDPEGFVERVRDYLCSLSERWEKKRDLGEEDHTGIEMLTENTPWLLPGADSDTKKLFVELVEPMSVRPKVMLMVLAKAGLDQVLSRDEIVRGAKEIIPDIERGAVNKYLQKCCEYGGTRRLQSSIFRVRKHGSDRDRSYSLGLSQRRKT